MYQVLRRREREFLISFSSYQTYKGQSALLSLLIQVFMLPINTQTWCYLNVGEPCASIKLPYDISRHKHPGCCIHHKGWDENRKTGQNMLESDSEMFPVDSFWILVSLPVVLWKLWRTFMGWGLAGGSGSLEKGLCRLYPTPGSASFCFLFATMWARCYLRLLLPQTKLLLSPCLPSPNLGN